MNFSIEVDINQLNKDIQKQVDHINIAVQQALDEFGERALAAIRASAPVKTGRLRDSFSYEIQDNGIEFTSGVEYAIFVEYGTVNQAAQPFFEISIRQYLPDLIEQIKREAPL